MKIDRRGRGLLLATLLMLTISGTASAYIDGGSASMLWQAIVAGALGFAFVLSTFWKNVATFVVGVFKGRKSRT